VRRGRGARAADEADRRGHRGGGAPGGETRQRELHRARAGGRGGEGARTPRYRASAPRGPACEPGGVGLARLARITGTFVLDSRGEFRHNPSRERQSLTALPRIVL